MRLGSRVGSGFEGVYDDAVGQMEIFLLEVNRSRTGRTFIVSGD